MGKHYRQNTLEIIYEILLEATAEKHDRLNRRFAGVVMSYGMAELVELRSLPNLIHEFDSDAELLPCFCRTLIIS